MKIRKTTIKSFQIRSEMITFCLNFYYSVMYKFGVSDICDILTDLHNPVKFGCHVGEKDSS
jgi:hypothetical protein